MISISQLSSLLSAPLCADLSLTVLDCFFRFTRHLKSEISLGVPDPSAPPRFLPSHVAAFLSHALGLSMDTISTLWSVLRQHIWDLATPHLSSSERFLFDKHGSKTTTKHHKLAVLTNVSRVQVTYFTRDGPFLAYSTSLRCKYASCDIRYYLNYSVDIQARLRRYYDKEIPEVIHLEEHSFIQTSLSELFTASTLFAWVSWQNTALIYNHALSPYGHEEVNESRFVLTSIQVRRAFVLTSLLKDWRTRGHSVVMREQGDLDSRLKDLICEHNNRMIIEGQPERLHACKTCSLRAVVTDGTALGHYCCKVHNCTEPLASIRHHWCPTHMKERQHLCVFTDCNRPARQGHRTCDDTAHSGYETHRNLQGKGFFLLRQRLQRAGIHQPTSSFALDSTLEGIGDPEEDKADDPAHKSDKGNRPSKVLFTRRWVHNVQFVVSACGIIIAQAPMFGAESISGVKDFLKSVYPNPLDLPDVIFYDNNCQLQSHLQAQADDFFRGTMLPVDVFHFKSKHKESDEFCQKHCNPSQWTELVGEDGQWVFNSSAAEQSNVWSGGYQAILRDMLPHNFNFFLDEMIKRRNEVLISRLRHEDQAPYHIPSYPRSQ
ncbi:MAG: hypothetical protein NXY57DRAFT_906811 [Lentinula lateritia]|nr:MAG: hypothetical protein NXY57DRAFT_906811 [Lentinula lateritia]